MTDMLDLIMKLWSHLSSLADVVSNICAGAAAVECVS